MSEPARLMETLYDAINAGDVDAMVAVHAEDLEMLIPSGPMNGLAAYRGFVQAFATAAPDQKIEAIRIHESGDTIVIEGIYSGTHTGPLATPSDVIPPTGRSFSFSFAEFLRACDGKIASHNIYWDNITFLAQLDLLPDSSTS